MQRAKAHYELEHRDLSGAAGGALAVVRAAPVVAHAHAAAAPVVVALAVVASSGATPNALAGGTNVASFNGKRSTVCELVVAASGGGAVGERAS